MGRSNLEIIKGVDAGTRKFLNMRTVCLIASDSANVIAAQVIIELLKAGCFYFMILGSKAKIIEDIIDDVIINENLEAVTTVHDLLDETYDDVVDFFKNYTNFSCEECRYLVILNDYEEEEKLESVLFSHFKPA